MPPLFRALEIEEMERLTAEEFQAAERYPLVVLLDNVRSLHNVGAIFRTADSFRLKEVALVGVSGCPPNPVIHKTALGAEQSVPWTYFATIEEALAHYQTAGYTIWCLEQATASLPPWECPLSATDKIVLVVGNEVDGVSSQALTLAERCIEIPQLGTKHSLNVSVSTGIALYAILQERLKLWMCE